MLVVVEFSVTWLSSDVSSREDFFLLISRDLRFLFQFYSEGCFLNSYFNTQIQQHSPHTLNRNIIKKSYMSWLAVFTVLYRQVRLWFCFGSYTHVSNKYNLYSENHPVFILPFNDDHHRDINVNHGISVKLPVM